MKRTLLAAALTVAALSSTAAIAQGTFPSKDITIIVQYGAGGGTDSFVRALEQPLEKAFGVNVAVRNVSEREIAEPAKIWLDQFRPQSVTVTNADFVEPAPDSVHDA